MYDITDYTVESQSWKHNIACFWGFQFLHTKGTITYAMGLRGGLWLQTTCGVPLGFKGVFLFLLVY